MSLVDMLNAQSNTRHLSLIKCWAIYLCKVASQEKLKWCQLFLIVTAL